MARRERFEAGGLRIESWRDFDGRCYVVWKPHVSIFCRSRKEVLRFISWPTKTPTGDAVREQLDAWEAADAARRGVIELPVGDANVEGSFDPLAHDVDTDNTRMVV